MRLSAVDACSMVIVVLLVLLLTVNHNQDLPMIELGDMADDDVVDIQSIEQPQLLPSDVTVSQPLATEPPATDISIPDEQQRKMKARQEQTAALLATKDTVKSQSSAPSTRCPKRFPLLESHSEASGHSDVCRPTSKPSRPPYWGCPSGCTMHKKHGKIIKPFCVMAGSKPCDVKH